MTGNNLKMVYYPLRVGHWIRTQMDNSLFFETFSLCHDYFREEFRDCSQRSTVSFSVEEILGDLPHLCQVSNHEYEMLLFSGKICSESVFQMFLLDPAHDTQHMTSTCLMLWHLLLRNVGLNKDRNFDTATPHSHRHNKFLYPQICIQLKYYQILHFFHIKYIPGNGFENREEK